MMFKHSISIQVALIFIFTLAACSQTAIDQVNGPADPKLVAEGWTYTRNINKTPLGAELAEVEGATAEDIEYLILENGDMYERIGHINTSPPGTVDFFGIPDDFQVTLEPQVILEGSDERFPITSTAQLRHYPYRTVGAIYLDGEADPWSDCTGTLVGPRHVLTAAHCLYNDGGWHSVGDVYFSPGHRASEEVNGERRKMVARYARRRTNSYDYGLIILEDEPRTARLGWLGMKWYNSLNTYKGKAVWNFGYPRYNLSCEYSPLSSGTCGNYMYYDICSIDTATNGYLMYDCDTQKGHSGSAVVQWNGNIPTVLGVHKRGNEPDSNAEKTSSPASLNLGPRMRPKMYNDLCSWIGNFPSRYANHQCY